MNHAAARNSNRAGKERAIDPQQGLRYAAETQDEAYRSGAYDYIDALDMAPRMAVIAGYVRHLGLRSLLDLGCGTGALVGHLAPGVAYLGVDISPTAIEAARARHAERPNTRFQAAGFRDWHCPVSGLDGLVWAGIARTWTRDGRRGRFEDWLEILDLAEPALAADAAIVLEMVAPHWDSLAPLIAGRYNYLTGCNVDTLEDDHRAVRAVRVFRRRAS